MVPFIRVTATEVLIFLQLTCDCVIPLWPLFDIEALLPCATKLKGNVLVILKIILGFQIYR